MSRSKHIPIFSLVIFLIILSYLTCDTNEPVKIRQRILYTTKTGVIISETINGHVLSGVSLPSYFEMAESQGYTVVSCDEKFREEDDGITTFIRDVTLKKKDPDQMEYQEYEDEAIM